jgi:carotenoid cleavage dioxygenase
LALLVSNLSPFPGLNNKRDYQAVDLSRFPYLQGNYAPIDEERDFDPPELWVEGEVPRELEGAFMRNGANTAYEPLHYIWLEKIPFSQNMESGLEKQTRNMHRMTLDPETKAVTDKKVSDLYCEFSKADDRRCGLPYRYGFATASNRQWADAHGYNCTVRFEIEKGEQQLWEYGPEANAGEPVYVPGPNSEREEDGYVMCYVYNPKEDPFISVLSAGDISKGPSAKIHVPGRVPNGFHANWMQGLKLTN